MGFLARRSLFIEGTFARIMYRSLYNMHEYALHGLGRVLMILLTRGLSRHIEPRVKLH
jgi:NADH dehydrogenase